MKARGAMNKEVRDATDKERHVCARTRGPRREDNERQVCGRRRDGEAAVSWVSAQCLETLVDVAYTGCRPTERYKPRPGFIVAAYAQLQ